MSVTIMNFVTCKAEAKQELFSTNRPQVVKATIKNTISRKFLETGGN